MSQPKFTGIWIPSAVFNNNNLTTSAKLLYGVVAGLDGDDGCYASNAYLQRLLGVSERGVQVLLSELDNAGIIQRAEVDGRRIIRTVESIALGGAENCTHITKMITKKIRYKREGYPKPLTLCSPSNQCTWG
jgi:hypothetical protein